MASMIDFAPARRETLRRYLTRHTTAEVRFDDPTRRLYATDASHYAITPIGVVLPRTANDLQAIIEIVAEVGLPIVPRGGGTSLSGQSIGPGVVVDCSKYLNQILELNAESRTVRVQPGVVLDQLNRAAAAHGLQFGPDVATANRATLGGMIGNNSAGARSVVYGQTVQHVNRLELILSDGTRTTAEALNSLELERKRELHTREGDAYRAIARITETHRDEIRARFPNILRRVSGYNLPGMIPSPGKPYSLVPLIVGSEGTLAFVAGAELKLVPKPKYRGLLVPHFDTLRAALDCLPICLAAKPSAVELMDELLIDLARTQRSLKPAMAAIEGHPAALLMVEFSADDPAEIADQIQKLRAKLIGSAGHTSSVVAVDELGGPMLATLLWNMRSAAVPLLYGIPGESKPITFCEDTAVDPARLPEFATRFRELFKKHGTDGTFYGHASVGCLHIRPLLNLHTTTDIVRMRAIMADVVALVQEFGGSLSGEHGDGLVRSEWNQTLYGAPITSAFEQIKAAFDPGNVFNPGKIVHAAPMEANLRYPPDVPVPSVKTVFDYSKDGGFFASVEVCNGAGVCRKTQGGAMCPSFRATRDERDSTRGRANALRQTLANPAESILRPATGARWLMDVMDLCLSCKACKSECPSNVDLAKLKAEFLQAYYTRRPRPAGHLLVKNIDWLSPLAAPFARITNWLGRRGMARWLLEAVTGIDRRRPLPTLHRNHFRAWFAQHRSTLPATAPHRSTLPATAPRVLLLDDCFTTYQEPQVGRAAVELCERAGHRVELVGVCCGRAMISKGFLTAARKLARDGVAKLSRAAAEGVPILGVEPSCILTLADEWPDLVPTPEAKQIAANVELADGWLARTLPQFTTTTQTTAPVLFHGHCHQKALGHQAASVAALARCGTSPTVLDAGCCGMAGAFGYEVEHYDLSVQIANLSLIPSLNAAPDATIIATGTSCRHQIHDLTGRHALHPVEWLAQTFRASRPA